MILFMFTPTSIFGRQACVIDLCPSSSEVVVARTIHTRHSHRERDGVRSPTVGRATRRCYNPDAEMPARTAGFDCMRRRTLKLTTGGRVDYAAALDLQKQTSVRVLTGAQSDNVASARASAHVDSRPSLSAKRNHLNR